jgi:hypothetical protein
MTGLRCRKSPLRHALFALYHRALPSELPRRLEHLLGRQSWQALSQQYWIEVLLQLVLAVATGPVLLPAHQLRVRSIAAIETSTAGAAMAMPPAPGVGASSAAAMALDTNEDVLAGRPDGASDAMAVDGGGAASTAPGTTTTAAAPTSRSQRYVLSGTCRCWAWPDRAYGW